MTRAASIAFVVATVVACSSTESIGPDNAGDAGVDASVPADATASDSASSGDTASNDAAAIGCGEFAGDTRFTCSKDGNSRGKCVGDASLTEEPCARGCLRQKSPADDVCMGTTDTFTCTGSYGTTPSQSGDYYISSFGCWVDPSNVVHTDPGDNCIPSCFAQAKATGLCMANDTGPQCEERINWFTADGARFGCLARLRVTNPLNGKAVIAVALDYGPGCPGENAVQKEVLDSSGRIDLYLFGGAQGASDHSLVHVVQVDSATPLGPVP